MVRSSKNDRRLDSPQPAKEALDVSVAFGTLSVGEDTARLGVHIPRGKMNIKQAEHYLCGSRLQLSMKIDPAADNDTPGQTTFDGIDGEALELVVDCKRYGAGTKAFTAGLTFQLSEIDIRELAKFAGHPGRIVASRIGEAGEDDDGAAGNGDGEGDAEAA